MAVTSKAARRQSALVVEAFYDALNLRDVDALAALVDESFDEGVVLDLPPSLPHGGRLEGAARLRRMFLAMAGGRVGLGPRHVEVERLVGDGEHVVAVLGFDWYPPGGERPIASGASEMWTFRDGKVASIRAFYWDTAALVTGAPGRPETAR